MINAEYFKEQIKELLDNGYDIAVVKGKPAICVSTDCNVCDFYSERSCTHNTAKWLISEHEEEKTIKTSKLADDTKVLVSHNDDFSRASRRYFAKNPDNKLLTYNNGTTSWTSFPTPGIWKYMWLEDGTRVVEG